MGRKANGGKKFGNDYKHRINSMKTVSVLLIFLGILGFSVSGCTTLRDAFMDRPNKLAPLSNDILGSTPRDEIVQRFGMPDEIDRRFFESFDAEVYFYYDRDDSKGPPIQSQFLACEFSKGILTAYSYNDSDESTQNSFDEKERSKLFKGKSTRQDAERLLGKPIGRALLPTTITVAALDMKHGGAPFPLAKIPDDAKEAWQYFSQNVDDYLHKTAQKTLTVFFDEKGVYLGSAMMQELIVKTQ